MSRENVDLVCRAVEVWNEHGWKGVVEGDFWHPEIEYHDDHDWPGARSAYGKAAVLERFEEVMELIAPGGHVEVERTVDRGDYVGFVFCVRGAGAASQIPYEYRWGYLCRIQDGQLDYVQAYLDADRALQAAGETE